MIYVLLDEKIRIVYNDKNRYSNDRLIRISGDTKTLFIEDNLDVSDTITTEDLVVNQTLTAEDLTVNDDLTVTGTINANDIEADDITVDSISRDAIEQKFLNIPATAFQTLGTAVGMTTDTNGSGVTVTGATGSWFGSHSLLDLPDGSTVSYLRIAFTPEDSSGFTVTSRIRKRNKNTGTETLVATVSTTSGTIGAFNISTEFNIDEAVDHSLYTYWVIINIESATNDLTAHEITVAADVIEYD